MRTTRCDWRLATGDWRLAELARADRKSYRHARHAVRLVLIFFWAVYALTLRELHPGIGFPPLSRVFDAAWTPLHMVGGAIAVVVMHFWLSTDRGKRKAAAQQAA